jgi:hypothetical protein
VTSARVQTPVEIEAAGVDDQPRRSVALRSLGRHHAAARAALDSNRT